VVRIGICAHFLQYTAAATGPNLVHKSEVALIKRALTRASMPGKIFDFGHWDLSICKALEESAKKTRSFDNGVRINIVSLKE